MTAKVSVRELRQNLSVYLRRVEEGETLSVTRRGEEVAMLGPAAGRRSAIDRLVAERGATRPVGDLLDIEPAKLPPGTKPLSDLLVEERESYER